MNPQNTPSQVPPVKNTPQPAVPLPSQPSKKKAVFWLVAPAVSVVIGMIIAAINGLTGADSPLHVALNVLAFILTNAGILAFIPGLIYGIILLNKK